MQKICILIITLIFSEAAVSQKMSNPLIGKNEFETVLFYFGESPNDYLGYGQHLGGAQMVRRWAWKKDTKVGLGGLVGVINHDPIYESDLVGYGALFGDITHFIGKRQKWSFSGQIGHGIFKREQEVEQPTLKGVVKHTAGMYYSISINYRAIMSKRFLLIISPAYSFRNFREKSTEEHYSPPSVEEYKGTNKYQGPGIRLGLIF